MALPIEDYAVIGDCRTAALVGKNGSIDWLCLPSFDSAACFAALVGTEEHGRWLIHPSRGARFVGRRYRGDTMILETDFEASGGRVRVIDFMPVGGDGSSIVRIVEGLEGEVKVHSELVIRFDYGSIVPWVRRAEGGITAIAGPDAIHLSSDVQNHGENLRTLADFAVRKGERRHFVLSCHRSWLPRHDFVDAESALEQAEEFWREWSGRATTEGPYRDAVVRSLLTLKTLTYAPTGGLVAAVTTSLPELIGRGRNWDYRYCWLRDATFSLYALIVNGYVDEARQWRRWLIRAVAGHPSEMRIMYGVGGERRLPELSLDWLPGYEGSKPVRVGNAASNQHQLDVYGEVMDSLHLARRFGVEADENSWRIEAGLVRFLAEDWQNPDEGIWEVRGPRQHFTHSKIMAWVAVDRAVRAVEQFGLSGPLEEWRALRKRIHDDVCSRGFDATRNTFVQAYGSPHLDASLLMTPLVGFLPPTDSRVVGTVDAIMRELMSDGFVRRYHTTTGIDGLEPGEGAFLSCTFWLADNLSLQGRRSEAVEVFERLLALRNDVGLLSEEYDPITRRFLGNFPQAFSHVALVNTARNLSPKWGPATDRGTQKLKSLLKGSRPKTGTRRMQRE